MTNIIKSFHEMNIIGRIGVFVGLVAAVSGLILSVILGLFNPYVGGIAKEVIPVAFIGLGLPAVLGFIASLYGTTWLMYVVFIYTLPVSLYLAGTPGIFRFFILVTFGYLLAAISLSMDKKIRSKNQIGEQQDLT